MSHIGPNRGKWVRRSKYIVLVSVSTRKYFCKYAHLFQWVRRICFGKEPCKGGTTPTADARAESAAPTELNPLLSVFTQGCISGFALIPPWALKKCRAYGTHASTTQQIRRQAQTTTPNNN